MKFFKVVLSSLLCASPLMMSGSTIYYEEFEALKNAQKILFEQELGGGTYMNQCNLEMYRPTFPAIENLGWFTRLDQIRRMLSLGTIHRSIAVAKELSYLKQLLQVGLCDINADLLIVTSQTMPSLYNYVDTLAQKAGIETPVVFISLKKDFFKIFSRKILMFTGSIVIGEQLLREVSDEELEATIAQQIAHIKYNHSNKDFLLNVILSTAAIYTALNNDKRTFCGSKLCYWFIIPALSSLILGKYFEKQVDKFVREEAGNSEGIIAFYERLQEMDQVRDAEFDVISDMLKGNAVGLPVLNYIGTMLSYYAVKAEDCVARLYNKVAYPSYQSRIDAANAFLLQQGM